MNTEVRTFTAESMQRALDIVREEMGSDAVILHTRQVSKRRMLPWLKSREEVEITAGTGVNVRTVNAQAATSSASSTTATATPAVATKPARRFLNADDLAPPPQLLKADMSSATTPRPAVPVATRSTTPASTATPKPAAAATLKPLTRAPMPARADSLTPRTAIASTSSPTRSAPATTAAPSVSALNPATIEIHKRLDALQQALTELSRQAKIRVADEVPVELFPHYTRLLDADIDEATAREFTIRLKREATTEQLANPAATTALLTTMIESEFRCAPPIKAVRGRRKVVALVGPTGVGKTTTLAKLAANFRLRDKLKIGLITVDTYRVAAVEQLRTYAEIIDLPMKVVTNPPELRRALEEFSGLDLVLIDTAGRSPNDELKLQELKSLLTDSGVDEIQLVLSLAGSGQSLEETAEKFASLKITSVIVTKLDEALRTGALLTAARRVRWPISYLTAGQNVPEDIEPAQPARLAQWVLGTR